MDFQKFLLVVLTIYSNFNYTVVSVTSYSQAEYSLSCSSVTDNHQEEINSAFVKNPRKTILQVCRCLSSGKSVASEHLILRSSCQLASLFKSQLRTSGFVPIDVSFQSCLEQSLYSIYEVAVFLEKFADLSQWPSLTVYTDVKYPHPYLNKLWKKFSLKTKRLNIIFAQHHLLQFLDNLTDEPANVVLLCNTDNARHLLRKVSEEYNLGLFETPNRWLIISEVDPEILFRGITVSFESNIIVATVNYFKDEKVLRSFPFKEKEVLVQYADDLQAEERVVGVDLCERMKNTDTGQVNTTIVMDLSEVYDHLEEGRLNVKSIGYWLPGIRQLNLHRTHPNLLRPLDGVHLTLAVIPSAPLTTVFNGSSGRLTMGAVTGEIFDSLAARMNFSYNILVPSDGSYGVKEATGWTGMVGLIARKEANLTGTLSIISPDRTAVLEYAPTIKTVTYGIMYLKPQDDPWDFTFYWSVFHPLVWLSVIVMIVVVSGLLLLTYQTAFLAGNKMTSCDEDSDNVRVISIFSKSAEMCLHTLTQKGSVMPPRSTTSFLVVFYAFEIFCVLIYTSYASNITSILTMKRTVLPFDSLQELADHPEYGIILIKGTSVVETLMKSTEGPFASAWKKIKRDKRNSFVSSFPEGIQRVRTSKVGFIAPEEILGFLLKDAICDYQFTSVPVEQYGIQFAYSKDFPYGNIFNSYIATMQETGVLYRLFKESGFTRSRPSCSEGQEVQSFDLKKIVGLFVILAFGIILSAIVTGFEWFVSKQLESEDAYKDPYYRKSIQASV